jgi:hypothetical protein
MQLPTDYRMLKRYFFNLSRSNLWISVNQNYISGVRFKKYDCVENRFEL